MTPHLTHSEPVTIPPRCFRWRTYLALRRSGFAWWHVVRAMWKGCEVSIVESEQA